MYKKKDVILTGFALFAMLFGAGNLIFPPMVGYVVGDQWISAAAGFFITGIGFPLLAILSSALAGKELDDFADKVSPLFSKIFNVVLILAIGPFLAIPRTGATAFELMLLPHVDGNNGMYKYVFLACYFIIVFLFSIKANAVIERIGKILTPILLIILAVIVVKGVFFPIGEPLAKDISNTFRYGFYNGYQTMDTLAAIIFSSIILKAIRNGRNLTVKQEMSFLSNSSLIAVCGLSLVYGGLLYIGATSYGVLHSTGTTQLLTDIVNKLLGKEGNLALGVCVAGACLTTAIGLTATVGDYFSSLLKTSYEKVVTATVVLSFIFAGFGVDAIVKVSAPILTFLYPVAIVLIVLNCFKKYISSDKTYLGAVIGAGIIGFFEMTQTLGINLQFLNKIYIKLPLQTFGLAWVVPSLIFAVLFSILFKKK
ncbi:branched-chain amino acid transport system II carrier protein [Fusobacterium ulcerans]|uniref:branched-chain amino acid transport system II carrier protein n=1 Tax=Fusobacterium ulcerans TaxID=861 RepID=UPI001D712B85|nr:branched-chain amino acid transport system II carrier protein [Fusobacterium ulcerans]MEE0138611.1 branched-chain amino acid transport system II carrier protein [Fusobacterium ulcerans]HJH07224.1 branched-chain amino acid transport system II carrier protein [Fusobacterium ulcerans]